MFTDGEYIYMLTSYKVKNFTSKTVKIVLETYEVSEERKMRRINELPLYKNEDTYYSGSSKNIENGGQLARGSFICNESVLLWWSAHNFHCYDMNTGVRKFKQHVNSTAFITCWDHKEEWYYNMDAACYSWLKRVKIAGFKNRDTKKLKKDFPDLPIILDETKSEILKHIKLEQEKLEEIEQANPVKARNDMFELLAMEDDE